ncbi:MAG: phosphate acetyltransferase [Sulfurovum sp.]|nr:phosphate acetyltransferase [Sulfurovum sp.]MDD3499057.1 phosphate acetyltransferase [Sulfurovum sp.]
MRSLYITATQKNVGMLFVSLGFMEILKRKIHRVAFFRPIIESKEKKDHSIAFMLQHYKLDMDYEACYGCDLEYAEKMFAAGESQKLYSELLEKFKILEAHYDFVLCEGLPQSVLKALEHYDPNLQLAQNFSSAIVNVITAQQREVEDICEEILLEDKKLRDEGGVHFATFVSRVDAQQQNLLQKKLMKEEMALYYLPELQELGTPTIQDLLETLDLKKVLFGEHDHTRTIGAFRVADMETVHFLEQIQEDDLVVVPADRVGIILSLFLALYSKAYPKISGIIFPSSVPLHPGIKKMIDGLEGHKIPLLSTSQDTYQIAQDLAGVHPRLRAENYRKIALALGLFEKSIDTAGLAQKLAHLKSEVLTPLMFEYRLFELARKNIKTIVLPESSDERILRAAEIILRRGIARIVLLGEKEEIEQKSQRLGLDLAQAKVIDPRTSEYLERFAQTYYTLRKAKGISRESAYERVRDPNYFATMIVYMGYADGMVSGAIHATADTIRPAFQIIKTVPGVSVVSSVFFMCFKTKVLVYGDCAVNLDPDAATLAEIAIASAETARAFGIAPKVAMLSYATGSSGSGAEVEKVREATELVRAKRPDLPVEGPIQYDAAIDKAVAKTKIPDSEVAGEASVFIFPDLNTGNNTYKAVQRSSGALAVGPILQGLRKPVNDLSRGCSVEDIVNTVAITAIQAGDAG